MKFQKYFFIIFLLSYVATAKAQNISSGSVSGNFQVNMQTYSEDTLIGAEETPEKLLMNTYANINYVNGNFKAGFRYEGYFNPLQGYDEKNNGFGIPYRYATYNTNGFDITVGNYYEQFGNGLIFRTYEDKNIGYDNSMEGIRVKYNPMSGVYFKGIIGRQRYAFSKNDKGYSTVNNKGLVRGLDGEIFFNDMFKGLSEKKTKLNIGGSFISKYQKEETQYITLDTNTYKLYIPENVTAFSGRATISRSGFVISSEYAYKFNDPSADNNYIYKHGEALIINTSYSTKGLGIFLSVKRVDNMSFRSDRTASLKDLNINYLPDISKNHTYSLCAMYPYATQANGEVGIQAEINYNLKRKSLLGGKYGMNLSLNYSRSHSIDKQAIDENVEIDAKGTLGYTSDFFAIGDELYFEDFNVQLDKKVHKKFKFTLVYQYIAFNYAIVRGKPGHENVYAHTGVTDMTFKITKKHAIRLELQAMFTKQDMGDWGMALIEYTYSPHWFITLSDQYNYNNPHPNLQAHYYNAAFGYKNGATRLQFGYGKQKEGIICVGGVCRAVPATNGFSFSLTSSF